MQPAGQAKNKRNEVESNSQQRCAPTAIKRFPARGIAINVMIEEVGVGRPASSSHEIDKTVAQRSANYAQNTVELISHS